jgi:hypothetical protein
MNNYKDLELSHKELFEHITVKDVYRLHMSMHDVLVNNYCEFILNKETADGINIHFFLHLVLNKELDFQTNSASTDFYDADISSQEIFIENIILNPHQYRLKPKEEKYRPFTYDEIVALDWSRKVVLEDGLGGLKDGFIGVITGLSVPNKVYINARLHDSSFVCDSYTFLDTGKPCGVLE